MRNTVQNNMTIRNRKDSVSINYNQDSLKISYFNNLDYYR
jgi:hypothetical protein